MAAGDITLGKKFATIESETTEHRITLDGAAGFLVNVGGNNVYLSMNSEDFAADGLQHDGEIELGPDDSIPLPNLTSFVRHKTVSGTSVLWFIPRSN